MRYCKYLIISILFVFIWFCAEDAAAQKVKYGYDQQDDGTVYKSIDEALLHADRAFRLKLVNKRRMDSLPEKIFQLKNLRELTVKGCKLLVLNQRICELDQLLYLNVGSNRLVRLPESIGSMRELKGLVISRNKIYELPESIGKLTKLEIIDAWDNPLYVLPESIVNLSETLKIIDLRQVAIRESELERMEKLLPNTNILTTSFCDCTKGER